MVSLCKPIFIPPSLMFTYCSPFHFHKMCIVTALIVPEWKLWGCLTLGIYMCSPVTSLRDSMVMTLYDADKDLVSKTGSFVVSSLFSCPVSAHLLYMCIMVSWKSLQMWIPRRLLSWEPWRLFLLLTVEGQLFSSCSSCSVMKTASASKKWWGAPLTVYAVFMNTRRIFFLKSSA